MKGVIFLKIFRKIFFTAIVTAVFFACTFFSANALSKVQEALRDMTDQSLTVEAMSVTYDVLSKEHRKAVRKLSSTLSFRDDKSKAMMLSDEEIAKIAKEFAERAALFIVQLPDGTETYNISVDFRTDDSFYYYNPIFLRTVAIEIIERVVDISEKRKGVHTIMDYTHVVGELTVHFLGYRITMKLGGADSDGPLGYLYDKFSIADLNVDEKRFPLIIRFFGVVVG